MENLRKCNNTNDIITITLYDWMVSMHHCPTCMLNFICRSSDETRVFYDSFFWISNNFSSLYTIHGILLQITVKGLKYIICQCATYLSAQTTGIASLPPSPLAGTTPPLELVVTIDKYGNWWETNVERMKTTLVQSFTFESQWWWRWQQIEKRRMRRCGGGVWQCKWTVCI